MDSRIEKLITEVESESRSASVYAYLPEIHEILIRIQEGLSEKNRNDKFLWQLAKGLGRLITEDYDFSNSPLGSSLLRLVSDIISIYPSDPSPE